MSSTNEKATGEGGLFKICSTCKEGKVPSAFYALTRAKDGRQGQCKQCAAAWAAKYARTDVGRAKGRIRARRWAKLPEPTRPCPSACEACGYIDGRTLHLDHCHETGKFRGWLCKNCNLGFGLLGDSLQELLRRMAYFAR